MARNPLTVNGFIKLIDRVQDEIRRQSKDHDKLGTGGEMEVTIEGRYGWTDNGEFSFLGGVTQTPGDAEGGVSGSEVDTGDGNVAIKVTLWGGAPKPANIGDIRS